MQVIKTILVPVDFSPASKAALEYAQGLADAFGASLHLIHAIENPFAPGALMEMYAPPQPDYLENLEVQARAHLERLLTDDQKRRYDVAFVTRIGGPAPQILEYVREIGTIDLIVMSTSGRGGVARLVMGSVTDKVVRAAPCPVVTLHAPERAEIPAGHRAA